MRNQYLDNELETLERRKYWHVALIFAAELMTIAFFWMLWPPLGIAILALSLFIRVFMVIYSLRRD